MCPREECRVEHARCMECHCQWGVVRRCRLVRMKRKPNPLKNNGQRHSVIQSGYSIHDRQWGRAVIILSDTQVTAVKRKVETRHGDHVTPLQSYIKESRCKKTVASVILYLGYRMYSTCTRVRGEIAQTRNGRTYFCRFFKVLSCAGES